MWEGEVAAGVDNRVTSTDPVEEIAKREVWKSQSTREIPRRESAHRFHRQHPAGEYHNTGQER
jgi:hypothetical protein